MGGLGVRGCTPLILLGRAEPHQARRFQNSFEMSVTLRVRTDIQNHASGQRGIFVQGVFQCFRGNLRYRCT